MSWLDTPDCYYMSKEGMRDFGFGGKRHRNVPQFMDPKAQGRNEKCNCGSGKKYKNCCGKRVIE